MNYIKCPKCGREEPSFDYAHVCGPVELKRIKKINIEQYCDGWTVVIDDKRFSWNHNDEDMGTEGIKQLLEHLGHTVTVEECY